MAKHPIEPRVNLDEYFAGLARQDLDFPQALGELIDNALSARTFTVLGAQGSDPNPANIEVLVEELGSSRVRVVVADSGVGMTLSDLQNHVFGLGQRGRTHDVAGSMNEHGFGLKNALAVLTGGDSSRFELVTRSNEDSLAVDQFLTVTGPFTTAMDADDAGTRSTWADSLQVLGAVPTGTRVRMDVDDAFFRTVWKRRGRASRFAAYVTRLAEHLGVVYREFLDGGDRIFLSWRADGGSWSAPTSITAIRPPYGTSTSVVLKVGVAGTQHEVRYTFGENDYQIRDEGPEPDRVVVGDGDPAYPYPLRIYYQGSSGRSGADVLVRNRVIRTQVWKEVWADLDHTVEYNKWLAEIELGDQFHTTNNKSGMDPNDPAWQALLDVIGDKDSRYSPAKTSPAQTEKSIEEQLAEHLRVQVGSDTRVAQQVGTWSGATTADIVVYAGEDRSSIDQVFEVKAGRGTVDDVYQLVCQWDGFVRDGMPPREGVLYCKTSDHKPATAVADLNKRKAGDGNRYNLRISHHASPGTPIAAPAKKTVPKKAAAKKTVAKKTVAKKSTAKKAVAKKAVAKKAVAKKTVAKVATAKKGAVI